MSLDEQLRRHYESKTLRAAAREELLVMGETSAPRVAFARGRRLAVAAGLAAVLAVVLGVFAFEVAVRDEVAKNHLRGLAPDFAASRVEVLGEVMDGLEFALVDSDRIRSRELRLTGARYCSIQGKLAAQLVLEDAKGERWTLFQAPVEGRLHVARPSEGEARGVRVEVWREAGVLLALASSEPGD